MKCFVLGWREPGLSFKDPTEIKLIGKADKLTYFKNRKGGGGKQRFCILNAQPLTVCARRYPKLRLEDMLKTSET